MKIRSLILALSMLCACEAVDDDIDKHVSTESYVSLSDVASILSCLPMEMEHLEEVHQAVSSSSVNGYDEEYMMETLFDSPGSGVGDSSSGDTRSGDRTVVPLKSLIEDYVRSANHTKSSAIISDPDKWLDALVSSDVQIYWPYSENWDGVTYPVITFDPEDGSEINIGYELVIEDDGSRRLREIIVDEAMAAEVPVWVVNRNSDSDYKTLEMLRKENPEWGEGGGTIIIDSSCRTKTGSGNKALVLKNFKTLRNFDPWFMGASELFVKIGAVEDFTATTEAELKLFNPSVTDFLIVVRRSDVGHRQPFNAVLISDWTDQMTHCALMIVEDDGGTMTEWKCTALVRIASKSYGVELSLPFRSFDDVVWRGRLAKDWLEANSDITGRFGDMELTFEIMEY